MDEIEARTNEAIAINAIAARLEFIGRKRFGIIEVDAKHAMEAILARVVADNVSPAYAEQATADAPEQERDETIGEVLNVLNKAA